MANQGGWARQRKPGPESYAPVETEGVAPGGVTVTDMPLGRPRYRKPRIKGVPAITSEAEDQPGGGTWFSVG